MTPIYTLWRAAELRRHTINTLSLRSVAQDPRASEGPLARNLRVLVGA